MEELRSTEILDKEIQDEARKKAQKILLDAQSQCQKILSEVDARLEVAKKEKEEFYNQKTTKFLKDLNSTLPLEKSRFLVSYISSSIEKEINEFLKNLSEQKRINLVLSMLNRFESLTSEKTFEIFVYGFSLDSVKNEISKINKLKINKYSLIEFSKTFETPIENIDIHEGIILVSDDESVKIRLTLEEFIFELIDKNREELANALFNGRIF